jgi:hypothetical protein
LVADTWFTRFAVSGTSITLIITSQYVSVELARIAVTLMVVAGVIAVGLPPNVPFTVLNVIPAGSVPLVMA